MTFLEFADSIAESNMLLAGPLVDGSIRRQSGRPLPARPSHWELRTRPPGASTSSAGEATIGSLILDDSGNVIGIALSDPDTMALVNAVNRIMGQPSLPMLLTSSSDD